MIKTADLEKPGPQKRGSQDPTTVCPPPTRGKDQAVTLMPPRA